MHERFASFRFRRFHVLTAAVIFLYAVAGYSQWSFKTASTEAMRPRPKLETMTDNKVAKFANGALVDSSITDLGTGTVDVLGSVQLKTSMGYFAIMSTSGSNRAALFNSALIGDADYLDFGAPPNGFRFVNSGNVTRVTIDNSGRVGINTTGYPISPASPLEMDFSSSAAYDPTNPDEATQIILANTSGVANNTAGLSFNAGSGAGNQAAYIQSLFSRSNSSAAITFGTRNLGGTLGERLRISEDGNLGVGMVPASTNKLDVAGTIHASGSITSDGAIYAVFQDLAEWVPVGEEVSPGTVVVLSGKRSNEVIASSSAYDTSVAGVVSAQPGIVLGRQDANKAQIATTGRVKVRVDARNAPIHIGDLLVTSNVRGTAMKSQPVEINGRRFHQPGTIIGKALEPLASGEGEILALLSLQ